MSISLASVPVYAVGQEGLDREAGQVAGAVSTAQIDCYRSKLDEDVSHRGKRDELRKLQLRKGSDITMRNPTRHFVPLSCFLLAIATLCQALPCAAQVTLSANQLNFGSPYLSQKATQILMLTNTSSTAVYVSPGSLTGDLSYQSTCPSQLGTSFLPFPPGSTCSLQVQFDPATVGQQTQTLSIAAPRGRFA
jgi:hypothetical protein